MSCIYFHSQTSESTLRGAERAHLGMLAADTATALLNVWHQSDRLRSFIAPNHYMTQQDTSPPHFAHWVQAYETAFRIDSGELIMWRGHHIDSFTIYLNTALLIGNDQLKLAARLHGQCEIYCYVEGPNRAWLADIMQHGRNTGLYRPDMKWEDVIEHLRERDDEPVVCSYSVTDSFCSPWTVLDDDKPDVTVKGGEDTTDALYEWWDTLDQTTRWALAMKWLRTHPAMELTPHRWQYPDYYFEPQITAVDLIAPDYAERLNKALNIETVTA